MPLGAQNVQAAEADDLLFLFLAFGPDLMQQRGLPLWRHLRVGIQGLLEQEIGVAAEQDVSPAARHVRRDGDGAFAAGLGDDLGFLLVMLGVQDVVLDAVPDEIASQPFRDRKSTRLNSSHGYISYAVF